MSISESLEPYLGQQIPQRCLMATAAKTYKRGPINYNRIKSWCSVERGNCSVQNFSKLRLGVEFPAGTQRRRGRLVLMLEKLKQVTLPCLAGYKELREQTAIIFEYLLLHVARICSCLLVKEVCFVHFDGVIEGSSITQTLKTFSEGNFTFLKAIP